jgi:hypothetical protein
MKNIPAPALDHDQNLVNERGLKDRIRIRIMIKSRK